MKGDFSSLCLYRTPGDTCFFDYRTISKTRRKTFRLVFDIIVLSARKGELHDGA
uniref:Uncharacterized protein n=1 Tax=Faecalibaculum rodentium TaxID=1702221 RepID=A0A140DYQ0_9FIRM|nr:hypothetical protein AALO17_26430 [Faecalibaculum rodentium]